MLLSSLTTANRQDQDCVDPVVAISLSVLAIRQMSDVYNNCTNSIFVCLSQLSDLRGGESSSPVHEPVAIDVEAYQRSENGDGVNIGRDLTKHTKNAISGRLLRIRVGPYSCPRGLEPRRSRHRVEDMTGRICDGASD